MAEEPHIPADGTVTAAGSTAAAPKPRSLRKRKPKAPPPPRFPLRLTLMVAAGIVALDQISKYLVVHLLDLQTRNEIFVIDPFLNLRMAWNQGMNFGLFSSDIDIMRWVLIAIAFAVCGWVAIWLHRASRHALPSRLTRIAAGLLIGGAIGNVIDRLTYGAVADFLNMSLPGWRNPYSFNVADIAIFIGAIGLVLLPPPGPDAKPAKAGDARRKSR